MPPPPRPVMLVVLDGWGWRDDSSDNAVRLARTPTFDRLWGSCPHSFLRTSGKDVGLPDGQMGNSEVGHLNIGAGRVVMQDLPRITDAVASGEIEKAPAIDLASAEARWVTLNVRVPPEAASRAGPGAHEIHFQIELIGTAADGQLSAGAAVSEKSTFVVPR